MQIIKNIFLMIGLIIIPIAMVGVFFLLGMGGWYTISGFILILLLGFALWWSDGY